MTEVTGRALVLAHEELGRAIRRLEQVRAELGVLARLVEPTLAERWGSLDAAARSAETEDVIADWVTTIGDVAGDDDVVTVRIMLEGLWERRRSAGQAVSTATDTWRALARMAVGEDLDEEGDYGPVPSLDEALAAVDGDRS